ncbi:hypothetical protein [Acinetobacter sp. YH01009]|uniref:hypothetical protein n=1 Tax=Acinetobacter TaxID=469 RepID=UPI0015D24BCF|nr:hypothetical protein [Acinetobacter sp. YH01009]
MLIASINQPLSSLIDMNRYTALCSNMPDENLPAGSQFKILKYVYGNQSVVVLKKFKDLESLDEQLLQKHFLRLLNIDHEALIYLSLLGLREAIIETDAFSQEILTNELEAAFNYLKDNDVRDFNYVVHMGYTAKYFNWNILRNHNKDEVDNPLTFWLFKNAMYSLFFKLTNN